jgi:hypothetical protein
MHKRRIKMPGILSIAGAKAGQTVLIVARIATFVASFAAKVTSSAAKLGSFRAKLVRVAAILPSFSPILARVAQPLASFMAILARMFAPMASFAAKLVSFLAMVLAPSNSVTASRKSVGCLNVADPLVARALPL